MVFTRGHRDNEEGNKSVIEDTCKKERISLQEPDDELFWDSDDSAIEVKRRARRLQVPFGNKKMRSLQLSNTNSDSVSIHLSNHRSNEVADVEDNADTDDDTATRRVMRSQRRTRNQKRNHSPIKKEFSRNADDDSEKSDSEVAMSGLRRSSRFKRLSSQSWLVGNQKLRGYPNKVVHSSEAENDEMRPSRKVTRYLRTTSDKCDLSSSPRRRSLRFRQKSSETRSHRYMARKNSRELLQRRRRPPVRYRDSQSDEDEEEEEENDVPEEGKTSSHEGEANNEEAAEQNEQMNIERSTRSQRSLRYRDYGFTRSSHRTSFPKLRVRHSSRLLASMDPSSDSEDKKGEEEKDSEKDKESDNELERKVQKRRVGPRDTVMRLALGNSNVNLEGKRLRKPVSRLTYEPIQRRMKRRVKSSSSSSSESKDNSDDDERNDNQRNRRYSLREKRKTIMSDRFGEAASHCLRKQRDKLSSYLNSPARKPVFSKRPTASHFGTMSNSSSSSDENEFEKRKAKALSKARNRCLPLNFTKDDLAITSVRDRQRIGSSLADIDPMSLDTSVTFESIGGLDHHIVSLKEMIVFPLLYPEVFLKFNVTPPRGVLFYGQPGTGKTLVARALANECSQDDRKIAFFMRKGADCLSKWVGESERQLRLLFDQAYNMRPSIIFFDEIDGLAPVRSTRQDQIHSSIVSTLLALMDGLDSRGEVVVIGATNRVDAIDPALRRPGRFDREFYFPLPSSQARRDILNIHTKNWTPPLTKQLINYLAERTVGYCGADLKALCSEATLIALRMRYPQIYKSKTKLLLDINKIQVKSSYFRQALFKIVPAGQRAVSSPGRKLNRVVRPLLLPFLQDILGILKRSFAQGFNKAVNDIIPHRPRLLITGSKGQGHTTHLSPAVLHSVESVPVHKLDLPSLFSVFARAPEEACAQVFHEAKRNMPSIIYIPLIDQWWATVTDTVKATFLALLSDLEPSSPVLLLTTSNTPFEQMEDQVQSLFSIYKGEIYAVTNPKEDQRRQFLRPLFFGEFVRKPKRLRTSSAPLEELPLAPPPEPRKPTEGELKRIEDTEEATLRELRIFLRQICAKLAKNKMFYIFTKPVDMDEVPDYKEVITIPMDLETMMTKIDRHEYVCAEDFLSDIDLLCSNALEYNPDRNPEDKLIRHRACTLRDTAYAYIKAEMDTDFEMKCRDIRSCRRKRPRLYTGIGIPDFMKEAICRNERAEESSNRAISANPAEKMFFKTQTFDSTRKKRRRRSSWARGLIASKKKKSEKDPGDDEGKDDNENVPRDAERVQPPSIPHDERGCDELLQPQPQQGDDATPNKIANGPICNGSLSDEDVDSLPKSKSWAEKWQTHKSSKKCSLRRNSFQGKTVKPNDLGSDSDEDAESSSGAESPLGERGTELLIDWNHLEAIYESCVSTTDGANVEELHFLYIVLVGVAHKHNSSLDRSKQFNEVETEIRKFAQFRSKT